jgi:hypothetical protein
MLAPEAHSGEQCCGEYSPHQISAICENSKWGIGSNAAMPPPPLLLLYGELRSWQIPHGGLPGFRGGLHPVARPPRGEIRRLECLNSRRRGVPGTCGAQARRFLASAQGFPIFLVGWGPTRVLGMPARVYTVPFHEKRRAVCC